MDKNANDKQLMEDQALRRVLGGKAGKEKKHVEDKAMSIDRISKNKSDKVAFPIQDRKD